MIEFIPHAHCLRWLPYLVHSFFWADLLTAAGYFTFVFLLLKVITEKGGRPYNILLWLLASVFVLCGLDRLFSALNVYNTWYYFQSAIKWLLSGVIWAFIVALLRDFKSIMKAILTKQEAEQLHEEKDTLDGKIKRLTELLQSEWSHHQQIESRLKFLLKNVPFEVAEFDSYMNYIFASENFKKQYGLPEKVEGLNHYDLLPEILENPYWLDVHKRASEGEPMFNLCDQFQGKYLIWYCVPTSNGGQLHFSVPLTPSLSIYHQQKADEYFKRAI